MDAFGNPDPGLSGAVGLPKRCRALGLVMNGQPFLLLESYSSVVGSLH